MMLPIRRAGDKHKSNPSVFEKNGWHELIKLHAQSSIFLAEM